MKFSGKTRIMIILRVQRTRVSPSPYKIHFWKKLRGAILGLNHFCRNAAFIRPIYRFQKIFNQDNLSFACQKFYKYNYLNILAGNSCFPKQVKN